MPPATCFEFPLIKDEVTAILQDAVLSSLEGNAYDHAKVSDWINTMTTACVNDLRQLCPNFKYIVTCFIKQRKGAGLDMSSCAFWDDKADGRSICATRTQGTALADGLRVAWMVTYRRLHCIVGEREYLSILVRLWVRVIEE